MSEVGAATVVVVLALAIVVAIVRNRRAGRLRDVTDAGAPARVDAASLGDGGALGTRATLVQFSSAFCRPCVATRHVLRGVAEVVPGVRHVEVDAESHLDLVRALGIASTPTTLLVDSDGVVRRRATGVPRRDVLLAAIADVVED